MDVKFKKLEVQETPEKQREVPQAVVNQKLIEGNIFEDAKILEKYSDRQNYGPQFQPSGELVQYSIVGKTDWF